MRVTTILVFISMLLMLSLNLEEVEARCYTNGCSIPFNLPYFYKRHFTPACNKHDVCYACGVRNGWSRYRCDRAFYRDMISLCRRLGWAQRAFCNRTAYDYFRSVLVAGWMYYKKPSLRWCGSCPRRSGDPNVSLGR